MVATEDNDDENDDANADAANNTKRVVVNDDEINCLLPKLNV